MGLFEIIGEFIDPGPVGSIDLNDNDNKIRQNLIPVRFIISMIFIGLFEYLVIFRQGKYHDIPFIIMINIVLTGYLLLSYFIRVKPDYSNTGWVPFLINNPFRISDNINRLLAFILIICIPGKFISGSIVTFRGYLKNRDKYVS